MMRPSNDLPVIYLCTAPTDFRRGMHSLSVLVESQLRLDPFSSHLFAFCNRRRTSIKILWWDNNGFVLWQKKLEAERFHWPKTSPEPVMHLNGQQLNFLLDGYDIMRMKPHKTLCFSSVL
jgi:transposase